MRIDREIFGYPESHFDKIKKAQKELWIIIKVYLILSTYNVCFSIISFIQANEITAFNNE